MIYAGQLENQQTLSQPR